MALHNARLDHAYSGEKPEKRIIEDLTHNGDLLAELLEEEHYVRDFGPLDLTPRPESAARVTATGTVTINTTTATAITGATVTFTPAVECYAEITFSFDVECAVAGATFVGEIFVDGAAQTQMIPAVLPAGTRVVTANTVRVLLTAASHTIDLRGRLSVAVGSYTVRLTHTGFSYRLVPVAYVTHVTNRQQVQVLPDAVNGELAVTFPRPIGWYKGVARVEVLYGGTASSANAWRVDLLGNALALTDAYTALADVSGSVDVPGIGTFNTAKWYSFSTLLLPVDRSHQMISFRLRRAGGHANDTYAGDVYVHCLRCRYLPSKHEV